MFTKETNGRYLSEARPTSTNKSIDVISLIGRADNFNSLILGGTDDSPGYFIKIKDWADNVIVLPPFLGTSYFTAIVPKEILYMEDADFPSSANLDTTQKRETARGTQILIGWGEV